MHALPPGDSVSFGMPVECAACGVVLEPGDAVAMWVRTPLGLSNVKACPGPCEGLAVQGYHEQPACRVTLKPTAYEVLRSALRPVGSGSCGA